MKEEIFNRKTLHWYMVIIAVIIVLIAAIIIMIKYSVEGEKKLPFQIREINIISTAVGKEAKDENGDWYTDLAQKNDVYVYLDKNDNYKKEAILRKIEFTNFIVTKETDKGKVEIYRPCSEDGFEYKEEYLITDSLEYKGAVKTDSKELKINNQGGLVGFSILTSDIGRYYFSQNEVFEMDGTLLNKVEIKEEDIIFKVSFDIIIETETGLKFKANYTLNLPEENILEEGIINTKDTELSKLIFKRF